jgi:predicted transcriptional regulator
MNILYLLTPKAVCACVKEEDTIRQALERMASVGYSAVPILAKDGTYRGTLTEGDLLWAIKNLYLMDMRAAENHSIMEIQRHKDNEAVRVTTPVESLLALAVEQNFVPVVDDRDAFIGIVTRKAIIQHCIKLYQQSTASNAPLNVHPPQQPTTTAYMMKEPARKPLDAS